jgi:hypothetical protein
MKTITTLILLATLLFTSVAWAQCATGVDTGGQCIPPDALGPQGNSNQPRNQPQQPRAVWSDRWGAIAEDFDASKVGTAVEQESKSQAEEAALSNCARHGGVNCQITLNYYNQCAAVAVDEKNRVVRTRAPTKEQAEHVALNGFGKGHITKIVYSACSLPVRIQ